jgi:hypothetical protein
METITFKGQQINRKEVLAALSRFDKEYPDTSQYDDWLTSGNYKYVLEYERHLYPPKLILSYVTGQATNTFSGGEETNSVFEDLDFKIRKKKFWVISPYFSEKKRRL